LCASVLIALVLCPFGSYASAIECRPIGVEDGALRDTHAKDVTVAAGRLRWLTSSRSHLLKRS
jgi:hypothetical protein